MSVEAMGYVLALRQCPDGAPLDCAHKTVLFCLADHHNRSNRRCDPSHDLLIEESLVPRTTIKRYLAYLEEHLVIGIHRPENQGRGQRTNYSFLILDNPAKLEELLAQRKGVQNEPLLKGSTDEPLLEKRGPEGVQFEGKRGPEGVQNGIRNKEESGIVESGIVHREKSKPQNPWQKILAFLQRELDPSSFTTWLEPTKLSHIDNGLLVVKIPTQEFSVIAERYEERIFDAINRLGYGFTEIELIVANA